MPETLKNVNDSSNALMSQLHILFQTVKGQFGSIPKLFFRCFYLRL